MAVAAAPSLVDELAAIVGSDHVRTDAGARAALAADANPLHRALPDAIVFPASTHEVAAVLSLANEARVLRCA